MPFMLLDPSQVVRIRKFTNKFFVFFSPFHQEVYPCQGRPSEVKPISRPLSNDRTFLSQKLCKNDYRQVLLEMSDSQKLLLQVVYPV